MTDILTILIAVVAIYFIMKIAFKVLKVFLILLVLGALAYMLMNYGFERTAMSGIPAAYVNPLLQLKK